MKAERGAVNGDKQESADTVNLIAAAPELLQALEAIVKAYDGPTVDVGTAISGRIKQARAAIAKARGEQ